MMDIATHATGQELIEAKKFRMLDNGMSLKLLALVVRWI